MTYEMDLSIYECDGDESRELIAVETIAIKASNEKDAKRILEHVRAVLCMGVVE